MFPIGTKVRMKTFLATDATPPGTRDAENYWRLIGRSGVVVSNDRIDAIGTHAIGPRALVVFDEDVGGLGLHCHNAVANALYIAIIDLEEA